VFVLSDILTGSTKDLLVYLFCSQISFFLGHFERGLEVTFILIGKREQ